ncbi:MAG: hypothetical protein ABW167_02925 [Baekduia sp.]
MARRSWAGWAHAHGEHDDLAEIEMRSLGASYVETAGILPVCAVEGLRLMTSSPHAAGGRGAARGVPGAAGRANSGLAFAPAVVDVAG